MLLASLEDRQSSGQRVGSFCLVRQATYTSSQGRTGWVTAMSTLERRIVSHSAFVVDTRGPIAYCFARTGAQAHVRISCDPKRLRRTRWAAQRSTHTHAGKQRAQKKMRASGDWGPRQRCCAQLRFAIRFLAKRWAGSVVCRPWQHTHTNAKQICVAFVIWWGEIQFQHGP